MLKYPAPPHPHGPHTFVDDAMYLKDHFDAAGGVTLIFKYTGKSPSNTSLSTPAPTRTATPSFQKLNSLRQRTIGARPPLSTSARILQQPGGVEALLQGAAKNMMERGEKLGINQAVRDAMGEFRRNLQESRNSTRGNRGLFGEAGPPLSDPSLEIALMEKRNSRLAAMLDESVTNLKLLAASGFEGEKEKHLETVEIAAAKVQFVRACLEDSTLALPEEELPPLGTLKISSPAEVSSSTVALDTTPVVMVSSAVEETRTTLSSPSPTLESVKESSSLAAPPEESHIKLPPVEPLGEPDYMDTDFHDDDTLPPLKSELTNSPPPSVISEVIPDTPPPPAQRERRPSGPPPTRSTLAQSSFAWMLEPDTTASSLPRPHSSSFSSVGPPSSPPSIRSAQKKRAYSSRERNAFLFGEVTADGAGQAALSADQIFGLQPIRRAG
jgi:TBC1 domain family protein 5